MAHQAIAGAFAMQVSPYIMTWSEIGRYLTWAVKTTLTKGKAKSKAKEEACPTGATAGTIRHQTSGTATASADSASSPADKDKSAAAPAGPAETHGSGQASASTGHEPDTAASSTSATAAAGREGRATANEPAGPDATAAAAAAGSSKPATDSIMVGRKHTARERIHKIADYIRDAHYGPQPSRRSLVPLPDSTTFTPHFSECCQHFLIHAGERRDLPKHQHMSEQFCC